MPSLFNQIKAQEYGWLLFVSVAWLLPVIFIGPPVGSADLFHHLTISNAWLHAFETGSIIPDWVYAENNGYGAVTVRFYPPLIHITLAVFKLILREWSYAVFAAFLFWSLVGSIGVFIWTKDISGSKKAAMVAASIFVFTPYHVNQFYHGFFWGEFVSLSIAPYCFYFVRRLQIKPEPQSGLGLCFCLALLILSNIPQLVVIMVCLAVYFLLTIDRRTIIKSLGYVATAGFVSLALTSFFWVRLAFEMSWLKIGQPGIDPLYDYRNGFLLSKLRLGEGGSDLSTLFGTYFLVVAVGVLVVAVLVSGIYRSFWNDRQNRAIAIIFLLSAFLSTFSSGFVWDAIEFLQRIQFPWRFLSMTSLCFSVLMGLSLDFVSVNAWKAQRPRVLAVVGTVLILLTFTIKQDIMAAAYADRESFEKLVSSSFGKPGLEDWHPTWTTLDTFARADQVSVANGRHSVISKWDEVTREFAIESGGETTLRTAIMYYPHWKAWINEQRVTTHEQQGALALDIPEAVSEVKLRFVEPEYSIASRRVSLVAWILFITITLFSFFKARSWEDLHK